MAQNGRRVNDVLLSHAARVEFQAAVRGSKPYKSDRWVVCLGDYSCLLDLFLP